MPMVLLAFGLGILNVLLATTRLVPVDTALLEGRMPNG